MEFINYLKKSQQRDESLFSHFSLNNILSIIHGIKFLQQANKNETNPTKKAIISNLVSDFNNMQAKNYTEDDIINVYHKYYNYPLVNQNLQDLIKRAIKQIDPDLKITNDTALNLTISLKDIYIRLTKISFRDVKQKIHKLIL